jgi:biofilm protein TabA
MAILGSLAAVRAQAPQTAGFATAFAYAEKILGEGSPERARIRDIAPGSTARVDLPGGAYAVEQVYESKARADGFFEAHRKYIDVQVVVEGEELMEVIDAGRIAVKQAYQAERDLILYADATGASQVRLKAGEAAIFFPCDVHMPGLRPAEKSGLVRKTVVKVPVE